MPLLLRLYNLNIVKWWVDAPYAMHPDFRIHNRATIDLVWGSVASMTKRQNLNSITGEEA